MDPITAIANALSAGAAAASKDVAYAAVKNSYAALRKLIKKKASKATGDVDVLKRFHAEPAKNDEDLRAMLLRLGADQDDAIVNTAVELLTLMDPEGARAGKYHVEFSKARDVAVGSNIIGDNNRQQQNVVRNAGSSNFGDHGRIYNFRDSRTRSWIIFATALAIILTFSAIAASTYMLWPKAGHPKLEVMSLEVKKPSQIDADYSGPNEAPSPGRPVDVTNADITLKNNGSQPVVITSARIEFLYVEPMMNCEGAGPGTVSANYDVKFPVPVPALPFTIDRDMRFFVKPTDADRLTINVGPQTYGLVPYLIVAKISLAHDNSPDLLDVGTIATVAPSGRGESSLQHPSSMSCVVANSNLVNRLYEFQAVRSDEVDNMHRQYAELLAPDPASAKTQCREWPETHDTPNLCAKYSREELRLDITLGFVPHAGKAMVIVYLDTGDPGNGYRVVTGYIHHDYHNEDAWSYSFEKNEGRIAASGISTNVTFDEKSHVLSIKGAPPSNFAFKSIDISVKSKWQERAGDPVFSATPPTAKLTVQRGN